MRLREVKCPAQGHTHTAGKRQRLHVPHICLLPGARILPPGSSCLCSCTEDPPSTPDKPSPSHPVLPKSGRREKPAWTSESDLLPWNPCLAT